MSAIQELPDDASSCFSEDFESEIEHEKRVKPLPRIPVKAEKESVKEEVTCEMIFYSSSDDEYTQYSIM